MAVLGNSFDQTIGLTTAGTELLVGQAGKVARGLRSIGNNIADMANKSGTLEFKVKGVTKSISLMDSTTGDMKNTFQVLEEINQSWNDMSQAEQQAIGILLAKKTQFEVFAAVQQNFKTAIDATTTSMNSQGSAIRENERYMESIKAKTTAFKAEAEDLAINTLDSQLIKSIVGTGTALLKLANTDIVQTGTQIALLTGAVMGLGAIAGKVFPMIAGSAVIGGLKSLGAYLTTATLKTFTFSGALTALTGAMALSPLFVTTLVVGSLYGLVKGIDAITVSLKEQKEKVYELTDSLKSLEDEYTTLSNMSDRTAVQENRLALLRAEIELQRESLKIELDKQYAMEFGSKSNKATSGIGGGTMAGSAPVENGTGIGIVEANIKAYEKLNSTTATTIAESDRLKNKQFELRTALIESANGLQEYINKGYTLTATDQAIYDNLMNVIKGFNEVVPAVDGATNALYSFDEEGSDLGVETGNSITELINKIKELQSISSESMDSGFVSSESLDKLRESIGLTEEQLDLLFDTESQLYKIDEANLGNLVDSIIQAEIASGDLSVATLTLLDAEMQALGVTGTLEAGLHSAMLEMIATGIAAYDATTGLYVLAEGATEEQIRMWEMATATEAGRVTIANLQGQVAAGMNSGAIVSALNGISSAADGVTGSAARAIGMLQALTQTQSAVSTGLLAAKAGKNGIQATRNDALLKNPLYKSGSSAVPNITIPKITIPNIPSFSGGGGGGGSKGGGGGGSKGGGGGGGGSGKTAEELEAERLKEIKAEYDDIITVMEHKLFLEEKNGATQEKQISSMKAIQAELNKQANYYRSQGLDDNNSMIVDLQKQWWKYADEIKKINEDILKDNLKLIEKTLEKSIKIFEAKQSILEAYADEQANALQVQIDSLEEALDGEIKALEDEKKALEEVNDVMKDSIRLKELEQNLLDSKQEKIRIYTQGGWEYVSDPRKVADAQKQLDEFNAEKELQAKLDRKDEEIKALEEHKEREIKALEERKKEWEDFTSAYKKEQEKLLNEQLIGMTSEQFIQSQRITDLTSFKDEYISIMNEIAEAQKILNDVDTYSNGGNGTSSGGVYYDKNVDYQAQINLAKKQNAPQSIINSLNNQREAKKAGEGLDNNGKKKYAKGSKYIPYNQVGNVNEDGDELFVPPRGNFKTLEKGSGVVPKTQTENIMEIGKYSLAGLTKKISGSTSQENVDKSSNVNIEKVEVRANNPNEFIKQMQNYIPITKNQ